MQLKHLVYFVSIAECGSINKAAEELYATQPNLSKVIMNIESELNVKIFERNNKGVTLTQDGKALYRYSRTILDQMELINRISSSEAPKVLSIASYPIITISRLMSQFYNTNADSNIHLKLVEKRLQKVIQSVEQGEAEIGFIMSNSMQSKELKHILKYKNLEYNSIGKDTWYVNVGKNSPYYDRESVNMRELLAYPFVRMHDDYFSNLTFYLEIDTVMLTQFKKVIYVNDSSAIVTMLHNTNAFRFGPLLSKPDFEKYGIQTIPIENCNVEIETGWIRRKKELLSNEAQAFLRLLEQCYSNQETDDK